MPLVTKTFATLVQDQAAAVQARARAIIDFTTGSVMRSLAEATAAVGLWLQGVALYILTITRLSTSNGPDADTWVNDWGLVRLGGTLATGTVTYARFTAQSDALIPVGAQVQTADGSQLFNVVIDADNGAWSLSQNGYLLPASVTAVTVPVQSQSGSPLANVAAGSVTTMLTNIVGVDTVTNPFAFAGGTTAETDAQLRARFVLFIASLSKSTTLAIAYAISSLRLGLNSTIIENHAADGTVVPGLLTITVDDGSGAPPQSLLDTVSAAIATTRAAGINWVVLAPLVKGVNIYITISTKPGYDHDTVLADIARAITAHITSLVLGDGLPYLKLSQVIYDASRGVATITTLVLNRGEHDIPGDPRTVLKLATLTVA